MTTDSRQATNQRAEAAWTQRPGSWLSWKPAEDEAAPERRHKSSGQHLQVHQVTFDPVTPETVCVCVCVHIVPGVNL